MQTAHEAPLTTAQRSKIRRLSQPQPPETADAGGEINVVPYLDIITNVMMFVLATVAVTFVSSVDATAGVLNGDRPRDVQTSALGLSVLITGQGVSLKTSTGNVATGCEGVGPGVTVPRTGEAYDLDKLTSCARSIKSARPEFAEERQVTVAASPGVEYEAVVAVMDALRKDERGELFPEVHLALLR